MTVLSRRTLLQATAATGAFALGQGGTPVPAAAQFRTQARRPNEADFVFQDGPVFTADVRQPWVQAVAVRDGVITYVGDSDGAEDLIGRSTRVIDLEGKLLLPGFVEGQLHPIMGAALSTGVNVNYPSRGETLSALAAWRNQAGPVDVVRGFGWLYTAFGPYGPSRADLDPLWPTTPVVLLAVDMRAAWANTAALRKAGIVRGVPDPRPGYSFFQREAGTGDPSGYVIGTPAVLQLLAGAAPVEGNTITTMLDDWLPRAAAEGITSLCDGGAFLVSGKQALSIYDTAEREKRLPSRVVTASQFNDPNIDPMPPLRQLRDRARTSLVQAGVLKVVLDGSDALYAAALDQPYADRPQVRGELLLNPGLVRDTVMRADAEGFDVIFLAAGDHAVRVALDAVEAAVRGNGKRPRRHSITHMALVDPQDIPRFGELGVIAQFSAQCAVPDTHWRQISIPRLGAERANHLYPMASLLRAGTTLAFGTDWPMMAHRTTFRPLDAIEIAVTRRQIGRPEDEPLPAASEALTIAQAVVANTLGAAQQLRLDDRIGSITKGKRADLALIDRDIFKIPLHEIHNAKVAMTLMNGVVRYEAQAGLNMPASAPATSSPVPAVLGREG